MKKNILAVQLNHKLAISKLALKDCLCHGYF
jgi:hypothetical protein